MAFLEGLDIEGRWFPGVQILKVAPVRFGIQSLLEFPRDGEAARTKTFLSTKNLSGMEAVSRGVATAVAHPGRRLGEEVVHRGLIERLLFSFFMEEPAK